VSFGTAAQLHFGGDRDPVTEMKSIADNVNSIRSFWQLLGAIETELYLSKN